MTFPITEEFVFPPQERIAILTEARRLLTEHGWTTAQYYRADVDCFCLAGAVEEAVIPGLYTQIIYADGARGYGRASEVFTVRYDREWRLSAAVLADLDEALIVKVGSKGVINYNDKSTQEDVLDLIDSAIALLTDEVSA